MLYLLPTDYIIWVLTIGITISIALGLRQSANRIFWQQLFSSSIASFSIIVLALFMLITLLDSVHIQDKTKKYTMLDQIIQPIGARDEVSYSAPMAVISFVNTTNIVNNKARITKEKLLHVKGRNSSQNFHALLKAFFLSFAYTLGLILIICMLQKSILPVQQIIRIKNDKTNICYKTIFATCLLLTFLVLAVKDFSSHYYLFGTSKTGIEVLYMGLKSVRTGLAIGLITTLFMLPLAIIFGIAAGFFGGRIDSIIQYIYTTLSSIPGVLLIAASILSLDIFMHQHSGWLSDYDVKSDFRLLSLCFILGVTGWTSLCRLLRGEVLKIRELDFIVHARVVGMSAYKIMFKHILPNVLHIIIITVVLDFSGLILAEAVLSYVGVGVDPTMNSWGNMINAARLELSRDPVVWWPLCCAVGLMFLMVLSINLLADKVRQLNDPRSL